ncbi:MAG TPA: hypothetical protein VI457_10920 [Methylococcaceae bacterium]|nr:hypothetical protein [Methylococcaceae bacterium]
MKTRITLIVEGSTDDLPQRLKHLLKVMGRCYGLKCVSIVPGGGESNSDIFHRETRANYQVDDLVQRRESCITKENPTVTANRPTDGDGDFL